MTPPASAIVALIATSVAKTGVVAPAMPMTESCRGTRHGLVRVYGPQASTHLVWNCQPFGWQELVSTSRCLKAEEVSPPSPGVGGFWSSAETTEFAETEQKSGSGLTGAEPPHDESYGAVLFLLSLTKKYGKMAPCNGFIALGSVFLWSVVTYLDNLS